MTPDLFSQTPFIAFWEMTRACDLACKHCRASARPERDPRELDVYEGKQLLDEIRALGCPLVVLTGGDPAKRPDLCELVRHGQALGLRMALTPSATPLLTERLLAELKEAGLSRLALSLDGLAPGHDAFRGVEGAFALTIRLLRAARELGLTTQINTSVGRHNRAELPAVAELVAELAPELWSVFFVVPTGRAGASQMLDPESCEEVLEWLAARVGEVQHDIKTTAAPHFRRVLLSRRVARGKIRGLQTPLDGIARAPRGINDGQGVVFVSHCGDILPSGFLPIPCGNVRSEGLTETYRNHRLFQSLRDAQALEGKCGVCPYKRVCGGSRARAYAMTGNPLAEDPMCSYLPEGVVRKPRLRLAGEA